MIPGPTPDEARLIEAAMLLGARLHVRVMRGRVVFSCPVLGAQVWAVQDPNEGWKPLNNAIAPAVKHEVFRDATEYDRTLPADGQPWGIE